MDARDPGVREVSIFPQLLLDVHDELIVDLFAGGGGASVGIEMDHINPVSNGGHSQESNLQPLCRPCNRSKGSKTMEEWGV